MKRYIFPSGFSIHAESATDFLQQYAELNDAVLYPDLVNAHGGKNLLWVRAVFLVGNTSIALSASDQEFVEQCETIGMFRSEEWDGLEEQSQMSKPRTKFVFWFSRRNPV